MVVSPLYKSYSRQIAKLFCNDAENKTLCEASIIERLNTFLDDYTYPVFISKINSGRSYITNLEQFQNKGFRIVLVDLITGERFTAWWEVPNNYPYLGILPGKLLHHQYNIISANKTFSESNKYDIRITWNPIKPNYGITFIPGSVGGGQPTGQGTSNGGGGTSGGGQIIVNQPPGSNQPQTPVKSSFDFGEIFSNPLLLIGGGVVLYLLMKD